MADKESVDKKHNELGVVGIKQANGYVFEEFLPDLQGDRKYRKYKEMADNDATIGALLTAVGVMLRKIKWTVEPSEADPSGEMADWTESVLEDMEQPLSDVVSEILTFLVFGFSILEKVYKTRNGDVSNPRRRSKFNDGTIGIRKLAPRAQDTIFRWEFDDVGSVLGVYQHPIYNNTKSWTEIFIPRSKFLLFKTVSEKGNPEGNSILRNCYKSYVYLNNIQTIEAIAIERELAGLPVLKVPSEILRDPENASIKTAYTKVVRDLKMGEQGGLILPSDPYTDVSGKPTNIPRVQLELMASKGTRLISTDDTIKRYQRDMATSIMADFLLMGQNDRGSFSMSKNKTDLFLETLQTFIKVIEDEFNRELLDDLWNVNGFDPAMKPRLKGGQVQKVDLDELGNYVNRLAGAGVNFTDEDTARELRRAADLPEAVDGADFDIDNTPDNTES